MKHTWNYTTPVSELWIGDIGGLITNVWFSEANVRTLVLRTETELLKEAGKQLDEYFAGKRKVFELPLAPRGTPFQQSVWDALRAIPYGETRSYGQIAEQIGNPKAARAVGLANNRNPIPIFIPCHRVIGSDGKLVGYGGGLGIKQRLLDLEGLMNHPLPAI